MTHVIATISTTNYAVAIAAGTHHLSADENIKLGGKDTGPAPYELLCSALGACTAITLRMYAERKEWPLQAVCVDLRFSRDGDKDKIARKLSFTGYLDSSQRARLAEIAERTPVTLSLKHGVEITTTVE